MLHRDIKPGNIKVTPHGIVKLVDFGLVKVMQPDDTRTVTVVQGRGTVAYTPLEQYGGDAGYTDPRSDIYSLGATLYHLLSGSPPANAKERFLHPGSLVSLRQLNPSVTPRVERAIFQSLAMHPSERPPDVRSFRELLLGTAPTTSHVRAAFASGARPPLARNLRPEPLPHRQRRAPPRPRHLAEHAVGAPIFRNAVARGPQGDKGKANVSRQWIRRR